MIRWRALAVAAALIGAPHAHATTDIQRVVSPGGIEAWLVEEPSIPMVALEMSFAGGASLDPAAQTGAAKFLSAMLDEGAGDLDSVAFSERADLIAAGFGFSASADAFSVSARMLRENLDESVGLLRLALTAPRLDEEPMRRVRAQILSGIRSDESDPNAIASKAWFAAAFPDDPYGRPEDGTLETVAALSADDLRAARARLLNVAAVKIGVVGAITPAELGPLLDRLLGALPKAPPPALPKVDVVHAAGVKVIAFDAPQSTVLFGHAGPLRADPDFIPAYVMNYILGGGGFSSRLTTEVREKRGLAYSTYAYLAPFDRAGVHLGGVGTANARVAEAIAVIRDEWRRMAETGVTAEELDNARRYLTGAYPLRFDSNAKIAANLVAIQRDNLGIDYITRRNALVEAVTLADVARVAARWLRPDDLAFVVVGQPEGLDGLQ